jgi:hypothetical protein
MKNDTTQVACVAGDKFQNPRYKCQTSPKFEYLTGQKAAFSFGFLNFDIEYCLMFVSWRLIIASQFLLN